VGTGGIERAPATSNGNRRRLAGTGGVERALAASSGHRLRRAVIGGVEQAPATSSGHRRSSSDAYTAEPTTYKVGRRDSERAERLMCS
jgi:hypothetical protein